MRHEGHLKSLTIFVGESDHHGHTPLATEIVHRVQRAGLAGGSVFRGVEDYGASNHPHHPHEAVHLLPDVLRLVRRLAGDPTLPRATRVTLWLLLAYLASPIDLVPDFVPVLGYADDAIVAAVALRRVVRIAGSEAIDHHWTGTAAGRAVVRRLAGLDTDR